MQEPFWRRGDQHQTHGFIGKIGGMSGQHVANDNAACAMGREQDVRLIEHGGTGGLDSNRERTMEFVRGIAEIVVVTIEIRMKTAEKNGAIGENGIVPHQVRPISLLLPFVVPDIAAV